MNIVNRNQFNDEMFEELANFAQHQIVTSPYRHIVKITKSDVPVAILEDVRIVFNYPDTIQLKARVTESVPAGKHITISKDDAIKIIIEAKAPNMEPTTIITVTKWFEELKDLVPGIEDVKEVCLTPNRWIYIKGTK